MEREGRAQCSAKRGRWSARRDNLTQRGAMESEAGRNGAQGGAMKRKWGVDNGDNVTVGLEGSWNTIVQILHCVVTRESF